MGIREKLLDFKNRLSDRKMYSIVIVLISAVSVWGIYQYKRAADLRQELDNQYNRAFYEMVGYVNNVETLLAKSMICTSTARSAVTLQEAWRQANMAQTNLGQLPVTQHILASTSKFLTQVGDLSLALDNQNIKGKALDKDQYKTIESMHSYSSALNKSLKELEFDLSSGRLKWGELAGKGTRLFSKTSPGESIKKVEALGTTFQDYPTLIYDGPFSDHMSSAEAKGLTGEMLSQEQARDKVAEFFGEDQLQEITSGGRSDHDPIRTYAFGAILKNAPEGVQVNMGVSQKGGHVIWMLYNRPVGKGTIDMETAKDKGREYLANLGFDGMMDTYYLTQEGVATINYAYKDGDVIVYPDLIKLKVALDNGEIVGMEARTYLSNHTDRNIPEPSISEVEAREKINKDLQINSTGLAIIPTDYKDEIFCYEFKGRMNDKDFIVYINAETGEEEDILMIVNTQDGILTM